MQAWSNCFQQHGIKDKLINWCFMCKQPESFFYINIYFSNRFLIQLIMENIPNFKNAKLLVGVVEKARQLLFSSLDEIIKCKWIIVNHSCGSFEGLGGPWGSFSVTQLQYLYEILEKNDSILPFLLVVLLCAQLNWKPGNGHKLYVLHFILVLGLHCTGNKKSPSVLTPVFSSRCQIPSAHGWRRTEESG